MNYRTKKTFLHGAAPRSKFYRIHVCTAGVCLLLCVHHNSFKQFIVTSKVSSYAWFYFESIKMWTTEKWWWIVRAQVAELSCGDRCWMLGGWATTRAPTASPTPSRGAGRGRARPWSGAPSGSPYTATPGASARSGQAKIRIWLGKPPRLRPRLL